MTGSARQCEKERGELEGGLVLEGKNREGGIGEDVERFVVRTWCRGWEGEKGEGRGMMIKTARRLGSSGTKVCGGGILQQLLCDSGKER